MKEKNILPYWDKLWKKDDYYAYHDIPTDTDGIYHLLKRAIPPSENEKESLLEAGSGPGTRSIPFTKENNLKLSLLDPLESAHKLAKKRAKRYGIECEYITGSVLDIPQNDSSYDYVLSIGLNEHFLGKNRSKCFSEMYRVTKKGGKGIVIVPNLYGTIAIEKFIKERNNTWTFGTTRLFHIFELKKKMRESGFKNVKMYGVSYFSSFVRLLPVNTQRRIFRSEMWKVITRFPGNLSPRFLLNRYFGEEIMAIGIK
jgi:SAM-dependent methyltransferase